MKVKNINGTSDNVCNCGSWLAHWEKFSNKTAGLCTEKDCIESAEVGAHVQKDSLTDSSWYIVPLCKKHNATKDPLDLVGTTTFVSANVSNTCGK